MKKVLSVLLIIIFMFSVSACKKEKNKNNTSSDNTTSGIIHADDNSNTDNQSSNSDNVSSNTSDNSQSSSTSDKDKTDNSSTSSQGNNTNSSQYDDNKDNTNSTDIDESGPLYKDIICQSIPESGWKTVELVSKSDNSCITLSIPKNWEIKDGKILEKGKEIGEITTKSPNKSINSYENYSLNAGTTVFRRSIEEYSIKGKTEYKRLFKVSKYTEMVGSNIFYILIDYSKLDNAAATKMLGSFAYLGADREMPEIENDSKVFLILGNSFLNTSKIAEFLSDMLITDGSNYTVEIRFGGTVVDFASDKALISEIENGNFAYIFQCGFYYNSAHTVTVTDSFKTIIDACKKSATSLVAFPAHNEHNVEINNMLSCYGDVYCLNWKEEINSLIESGVSYTTLTEGDFCINDNYKHSTPLAGYVGAHLIYRNIFGKMPPELSSTAPLDMSTINNKLLTYPTTGIVPGKQAITKYFI